MKPARNARMVAVRPVALFCLSKQAKETLSAARPTPQTVEQKEAEAWITRINIAIRPLLISAVPATGELLDKIKQELLEVDSQLSAAGADDRRNVNSLRHGAGPQEEEASVDAQSSVGEGFFQPS